MRFLFVFSVSHLWLKYKKKRWRNRVHCVTLFWMIYERNVNDTSVKCSHPNSIISIIPTRTERTLFRFFLSFFSTRRKEKLKRSRKVFLSSFLIFKRKKERSQKSIGNKGKKKEKTKEEEGGKPSRKEEGKRTARGGRCGKRESQEKVKEGKEIGS